MKQARVRRLPVLGFGRTVLGILSMNDILRVAGAGRDVSDEDVVATLQAICAHHHPTPHVVAACDGARTQGPAAGLDRSGDEAASGALLNGRVMERRS